MVISASYINTTEENGTPKGDFCLKKEVDGVTAVYFSVSSRAYINSDLGGVIQIGDLGIKKWMADWRYKEFWCCPAFGGEETDDIPNNTQCLLYIKADGKYGVILPVVSEVYKCTLEGAADGIVEAKLYSWCEGLMDINALAFVTAEGDDPYKLIKQCVQTALKLLNNGCKHREERVFPEVFKYLGWCSWDAFQIRVDEDSLVKKCQEFKDKQIPVRWAIIDDMWGEVRDFWGAKYESRQEMFRLMHASKLYSFKADPKRFPNGLEGCIHKINEYGIKVGMWHPTTGYWMGVDPEGEIYRDYKDLFIEMHDGRLVPSYEKEKSYKFYSTYHRYLKQCGAEFIKLDNQSMTRRFYKGLAPVGQTSREFHEAMEQSAKEYFDSVMINCMGMASEDMWNRSDSPISRCSDDFIPEDREWFAKHITQCAYNTLIQGEFYYPDWDMWWTDDGQAGKNSLLRAVSGGPIYVSDTLDRSRKEIIDPLCLSDGEILMCDRPAAPTRDCLLENPVENGKIFKIQNIANQSGVIALYNLDAENGMVEGTVSPTDVEGLCGEEFALYEYFSKTLQIVKGHEKIDVRLENNDDYRLYIIVPLKNGRGVIGKVDKFISPKTVEIRDDGSIVLRESGTYAFVEDNELVLRTGEQQDLTYFTQEAIC